MVRIATMLSLLLLFLTVSLSSQETLTNDSVAKLVKAGLSEDLVISTINSQPGKYSLGVEEIIALKNQGISEKIIAAMIKKNAPEPTPKLPDDPAAAGTSSNAGSGQFTEVGVYYKKSGEWTEVLPEIVNWATGGTLKNLGSFGIVKKDVNGRIPGAHSRNSIALPAEFVIRAPESVSITEYQLLRLRPKEDFREFRTVTGGVFNQRGGATRDMVPFEGKKIGERLFSVILPNNLGAGDYGFLWGGAAGAAGSQASLSLGKMYTFRVIE